MLKDDIIKKLEELQGYEKAEFKLNGVSRIVYVSKLINNVEQEIIIAQCVDENNTAIMPYCSIDDFYPYHGF